MGKIKKLLVIAGSAKTGTSSLAIWLDQRDDMELGTEKESRFFAGLDPDKWAGPASDGLRNTMIMDAAGYEANFPSLRADQWAIDASTDYLWTRGTDKRLAAFADDCEVKVICIAREPVSRAVSEYNHTLGQGWEHLSFTDSLAAEDERHAANWHPLFYHKRRSEISRDITRFHETFGDDLLVLDYTDMRNGKLVMSQIAVFLGVPDVHVDTEKSYNVTFLEKNKLVGHLKKSKTLIAIGRAILPSGLKKRLWNSIHVEAKQKVTVTDAEKAAYAIIMADEIAACKANPLVPTDRW
jgi:hypothetical protein